MAFNGYKHFNYLTLTAKLMFSKVLTIKRDCYACQLLNDVSMHTCAKSDQNIPCVIRAMSILHYLLKDGWTNGHIRIVIILHPWGRAILSVCIPVSKK